MPKRNAVAILLAMFLCSLCYSKAMLIRPTEPLADALSLIEHRYVKATDQRELVEAAMHAVVDKLDPYSEYFGPRHAEMFQQELAQSFPGIGVLIDKPKDSARARVVTPLVGSPALRAGILPNDELWSIEGEDVEGWDVEQIRGKLRGPEGTAVSIEVKRESEPKPVPIHVERASIPIDSVVGYQRLEGDVWSYYLPDHHRLLTCESRCSVSGLVMKWRRPCVRWTTSLRRW